MSLKPVAGASAYLSNSSSLSLFSTPSSDSASSLLAPRQVSSDESIMIQSSANSVIALSTLALPEKRMSTSANWKSLNDDYFFSISIFLSPEETVRAFRVCKAWKESLDKPAVWEKLVPQIWARIYPL